MTEHLTEENIAEFKKVFTSFDKNGDGTIIIEDIGIPMVEELLKVMKGFSENPGVTVLKLSLKPPNKPERAHSKRVVTTKICSKSSFAYLKDMIKFAHTEGNGTIYFDDFCQMLAAKYTEKEIEEAFKDFDLDGDGFITADELKTVYKNSGCDYTDDEIDKMFRETDTDGDGKVDFKEFTRAKSLTLPENHDCDSEEVVNIPSLPTVPEHDTSEHEKMSDLVPNKTKNIKRTQSNRVVKNKLTSKTSCEYMKDMIKFITSEGNGTIFYQDFSEILAAKYTEEEVLKAFKDFDLDGDGFITASELKTVYKNSGEDFSDDEIDRMFREADTDGDGKVDFGEFTRSKTIHSSLLTVSELVGNGEN